MALLIHLPSPFPEQGNRSKAVASLVSQWLDNRTPLIEPPNLPASARVSISLPASLQARIQAAVPSLSPHKAVTAILFSLLHVPESPSPTKEEPSYPFSDGRCMKGDQLRFYKAVNDALATNPTPIVLAEGGTGLGKSLVISTLAMESMQSGLKCIIAAPSIQVLGQIRQEFMSICPDSPPPPIYLGRAQFVCCTRLLNWLEDVDGGKACPDAEAVRQWLLQGGMSSRMGTPSEVALLLENVPYLVDDLHAIAPSVPVEVFSLDAGNGCEGDPGLSAYDRQRGYMQANVAADQLNTLPVFATHSALIWDARIRHKNGSPLLPKAHTLLLDEAHLFHEIAEAAFSHGFAFRSLSWVLEEGYWRQHRAATKAEKAKKVTLRLMSELRQNRLIKKTIGQSESIRLSVDLMREFGVYTGIRELLSTLKDLPEGHSTVEESVYTLTQSTSENCVVDLRFSNVQRYPSLSAGPRSLRFFFEPFWASWPCVALFSGTMYLPREDGGNAYSMLSVPLCLPSLRVIALPPIHPAWSKRFNLIVVPQGRADLVPPSDDDEEDTQQTLWHEAVAREIAHYQETAAGGMVCLLTGYRHITGIAARLGDFLPADVTLVIQERGGFRRSLSQFLEARKRSEKVIWLAAGPAWVGMDIVDRSLPPHEDFLFTDLVIPRIPYGTLHSTAHHARMEWMKTAERDRAAMQFRQGAGRLMRREGLLKRRLIFLDGRVHDLSKRWLIKPIKLILEKFLPPQQSS